MSSPRPVTSPAQRLAWALAVALWASAAGAHTQAATNRSTAAAAQPATLQDALLEIQALAHAGRPRAEIARRATEIADNQITNVNDIERMSIGMNWLSLVTESAEDQAFADWRDHQSGAEAQYDRVAQWVWSARYGECAENSGLVYYLLKEAGLPNVRLMKTSSHRFCVWGMAEDADPNSAASWTEDVMVPDSWSGTTSSGASAWGDRYLSNGGRATIQDVTEVYDSSATARCGFRGTPCCTGSTGPCRGGGDLACHPVSQVCSPCGRINQTCCAGAACGSGLECQSGRCLKPGTAAPGLEVWFPPRDTLEYSGGTTYIQARLTNPPPGFGAADKAEVTLAIDGGVVARDSVAYVDFSIAFPRGLELTPGTHAAVVSATFSSGALATDAFTVMVPLPTSVRFTDQSGTWQVSMGFPGGQVDTAVVVPDPSVYGPEAVVELRLPRLSVRPDEWPLSYIPATVQATPAAGSGQTLKMLNWYSLGDPSDPTTRSLLAQDPGSLSVQMGSGHYLLNIYPVQGPYSMIVMRLRGMVP